MNQLSIFIDQIQRPSFLRTDEPVTKRKAQPSALEKREQVRKALRGRGKVTGTFVVDYTGYTKQSVNYLLSALADSGEIQRFDGGARILWELIGK